MDKKISQQIEALFLQCRNRNIHVATAESCTGGMLGAWLTEISGSSDVFERGFVTYSNQAKQEMLGVSGDALQNHGAVSKEVACEMVRGVLVHAPVELAVAITGIAGPKSDESNKPVGLVHIAAISKNGPIQHKECHFKGGRNDVREASCRQALSLLVDCL